jgi:hypothetical protein
MSSKSLRVFLFGPELSDSRRCGVVYRIESALQTLEMAGEFKDEKLDGLGWTRWIHTTPDYCGHFVNGLKQG